MRWNERQQAMEDADGFAELLSVACDTDLDTAKDMVSRINTLESFFESQGHSRGKPRKMAVLYVMMRHGHTARTVEKWWGKTDSTRNSFSADLGKTYLEDIKETINDKVYDGEPPDDDWTAGDDAYLADRDPLSEHFDIEKKGRNAKLGSFG